jgi:hypothetical protein
MSATAPASRSASKFSGDYYWLLANGDKTGNFIDPNEDQFDLPFHNRTRPDISRKHAGKTLEWVQPGDRFIGYASTPNRVMALFEVTANVPGDGIKFRRIKLLAAPVEWSALKTRHMMQETHWPKSSVTQLHPIEIRNVGETIWNVIKKEPGIARPTDDSRVLSSPTDENKTNLGPPLQTTNVVASNATIEIDVGASNEALNDTVEPNAFDDLKAHEAELNAIPDETERDEVRKSRIGQGKFRKKLIEYWGGICAVTGLSEQTLLRASHIRPWRSSDNHQRLYPFNGLLLAPHLDALFDGGFISFDDSGRIVLSPELTADDQHRLGVNDELALRSVDDRHKEYLRFHRENRLRPRPTAELLISELPEAST